MRVSLPITILSCILVVGITWWIGTRGKDFMTPPTESKLAQIRNEVERSMPATDHPRDALSAPSRKLIASAGYDTNRNYPIPVINLQDLTRQPKITEYQNVSKHGPGYLTELAELLELNNQNQRALLAWERVLDSTNTNDNQSAKAIKAIIKLRGKVPKWNGNPDKQIPIRLNVGTDAHTAEKITATIETLSQQMEEASAGILKVSPNIIAGEANAQTPNPAPVAVWLTGPTQESKSTEILSFSVTNSEPAIDDATATIYRLLRGHLSLKHETLTPPVPLGNTSPNQALRSKITRLSWQKLGESLN